MTRLLMRNRMTTATNQKPKTKSQTNQDHLPVKALASDPFDVSVWFGNDGNFFPKIVSLSKFCLLRIKRHEIRNQPQKCKDRLFEEILDGFGWVASKNNKRGIGYSKAWYSRN